MADSNLFRMWASVLAAVLVASILAVSALTDGASAQQTDLTGETVVLDPGHGGSDSGAANGRYDLEEKDQNLDVAYRLRTLLEASGAKVYMTRGGDPTNPDGPRVKDPGDDAFADDATLSNEDRYRYANRTGAKILVSIHMNGSSNPATDYTTTLFGKWRKDKVFAQTLFRSLSTLPAADGPGTIKTKDPYLFASGVLLKSNMPAAIAETVFVTSDAEGRLLSDGTGARQQQIAQALATGVEDYLSTH